MRIVNSALKRTLRARAHALKPVVIVADRGLDDTVVEETRRALEHHELIKVRIRRERGERQMLAASLCETIGAALIQSIGQVVCLYRPRPQSATYEDTKRPAQRTRQAARGDRHAQPWPSAKDRKRAATTPRQQS